MIKQRRSLKNTAPSNKNKVGRPKPMSPPGGLTRYRKRYSCGGKVKK